MQDEKVVSVSNVAAAISEKGSKRLNFPHGVLRLSTLFGNQVPAMEFPHLFPRKDVRDEGLTDLID